VYHDDKLITAAFAAINVENDGKIKSKDLQCFLRSTSLPEEVPSPFETIIKEVDKRGEGFINYERFKEMMLHD